MIPHRRTPARSRLAAISCFMLIVLSVCATTGVTTAQDAMTAQEQIALEAGELVTRPLHVRRSGFNLIGGSSWQRIDAPTDQLWLAVQDVSRYPKMLPNVTASRVVERHDDRTLIFIAHGAWPFQASYYAWLQSDAASQSITFRLATDRPHSLAAGWGSLQLVAHGEGSTILVFSALVDVGQGVLAALAQPLIQPWMLRVPSTIKRFGERAGRTYSATA
jgi:ribosome-associated toxin RatA of RatAB toxin-antitoxin module